VKHTNGVVYKCSAEQGWPDKTGFECRTYRGSAGNGHALVHQLNVVKKTPLSARENSASMSHTNDVPELRYGTPGIGL
jgi:hypothetical protein